MTQRYLFQLDTIMLRQWINVFTCIINEIQTTQIVVFMYSMYTNIYI